MVDKKIDDLVKEYGILGALGKAKGARTSEKTGDYSPRGGLEGIFDDKNKELGVLIFGRYTKIVSDTEDAISLKELGLSVKYRPIDEVISDLVKELGVESWRSDQIKIEKIGGDQYSYTGKYTVSVGTGKAYELEIILGDKSGKPVQGYLLSRSGLEKALQDQTYKQLLESGQVYVLVKIRDRVSLFGGGSRPVYTLAKVEPVKSESGQMQYTLVIDGYGRIPLDDQTIKIVSKDPIKYLDNYAPFTSYLGESIWFVGPAGISEKTDDYSPRGELTQDSGEDYGLLGALGKAKGAKKRM